MHADRPNLLLTPPRFLLGCLTLACLAQPAHAQNWTMDTVMDALAKHGSGRASYVENKTLAILDIPIQSSGELRFRSPDFLEMRTLKPQTQTLTLQGSQLSIESGRTTRQINLDSYPYVSTLIGSIRATLNGDARALRQSFKLKFSNAGEQWNFVLVPLDPKARQHVSEIRIGGSQDQIRKVEVDQADGDTSQMLIQPLTQP